MKSILVLIMALHNMHPSIPEKDLTAWVFHLDAEAKSKSFEITLLAAIIERASQWRPNLVNCNGSWLGITKPTTKALTAAKVVKEKLTCSGSLDLGFGQLNFAKPSYKDILLKTEPKTNITLLANYLLTKRARCVKVSARLLAICKERGWLALLNMHARPKVEEAILNIKSKLENKMKELE